MGCDIHLYVEKRIEGKWVAADLWMVRSDNGDCIPLDQFLPKAIGEDYIFAYDEVYRGRNYALFAILADVRNFEKEFVPIAPPRGIPDDSCVGYLTYVQEWGGQGHSHSWFTLKELLEFDWTRTVKREGWADLQTWADWIEHEWRSLKRPVPYYDRFEDCIRLHGDKAREISAEEMKLLVEDYRKVWSKEFLERHEGKFAVACWEKPYSEFVSDFFTLCIPRLLKIAGSIASADDVRIVFFFDN